jgi:type I restriction enzyme, S subunit
MSSETVETVYGLMPRQLSCANLKDLCVDAGIQTGPFGSQLHQEDYVQSGTPIITVEHLGENRIVHTNLPQVSDEDKARLSKYVLKTGDIVFSRVGSVDRRALVQPAENGWLFSGRCLRVRPNPDQLDAQWLSYFFGLPAFKNYIRGIAVGATMPSLNTKILSDVPVYFPDLNTQKAAAEVLAKIDDRITLLRETNTTLEAIAQALFKSWFVDFDPVHAKMQGRTPEGMDEATAALFPESFEESELGPVPKGWKPIRLDSFIELAYGKALKSDMRRPGAVPVYGSGGITGWHDTALVKEASVVVGRKGTVGSIYWESRPFFPIDTVFYVKASKPLTYCHQLLMMLGLNDMNTDAAVPGLNRENVYRLQVPDAPSAATAAFDDIVSALRRSINRNNDQVHSLADLRDTLLPRLISGQLQLLQLPEASVQLMEALQ